MPLAMMKSTCFCVQRWFIGIARIQIHTAHPGRWCGYVHQASHRIGSDLFPWCVWVLLGAGVPNSIGGSVCVGSWLEEDFRFIRFEFNDEFDEFDLGRIEFLGKFFASYPMNPYRFNRKPWVVADKVKPLQFWIDQEVRPDLLLIFVWMENWWLKIRTNVICNRKTTKYPLRG